MSRPWFESALRGLLRLFYPTIGATWLDRLPTQGPVIVVANHPNGLMDPVVISIALGRPLRFLGKSTFWSNPVGRFTMESLDVLPAYRAHEADTAKNELTFALCRAHLAQRGWLALFPEGKSHSQPNLQPLKTGAARIALSSEAERPLGLKLLPVGLIYEQKETFRTSVTAVLGEPIEVSAFLDRYALAPREAAQELTEHIHAALGEVVLQARDGEFLRGLLAVAAWTAPTGARDTTARDARALQLAAAARRLALSDPAALEALVASTRQFAAAMAEAGVDDPFSVEEPAPARLAGGLISLALLLPFALLGGALAWLPYRAVKPIAERVAGTETDLFGTVKVLLGLLVLSATYAGWSLLAALLVHPLAGVAMLLVGPLSGFAALRFSERATLRRRAIRGLWVATRGAQAEALRLARHRLCEEVDAALAPGRIG